jgi:ankyrin repeat protein
MQKIKISALLLSLLLTSNAWSMEDLRAAIEQTEQEDKEAEEQLHRAFIVAAEKGELEKVQALLPRVDVNFYLDKRKTFALWQACQNGHYPVVELLLEQDGILPNMTGLHDRTPLCQASQNGHEQIVALLLENGAREVVNQQDDLGITPVWIASKMGRAGVIDILIEAGADITIRSFKDNALPIHAASNAGSLEAVEKLLHKDPDSVNARWKEGATCLRQASQKGFLAVAHALINARALVDVLDDENCSPITVASSFGHGDVLELLLGQEESAPCVNAPNTKGQTPIFMAVSQNHPRCVELLLNAKANLALTDNFGKAPADYARNQEMLEFLEQHMHRQDAPEERVVGQEMDMVD